MRTKIIFMLLVCGIVWACSEEDDLTPSRTDQNWFVVEDDPNDPLTHLRYQIYTDYGVPVFYNDTLGAQIRYDRHGEAYTYYEILKVDYNLSSYAKIDYVLADDTTDVMLALELMDKYLFKYLPEDNRPISYLLVDSIVTKLETSGLAVSDDYYQAFTTTCIGNIERFKTMNDSARESFMAELAGIELVDEMLASADSNLIHQFDSAAFFVRLDAMVYSPNRLPSSAFRGSQSQISTVRTLAPPEAFGLLHYRGKEVNRIYYPTMNQDYAAYIGLVLRCKEDEVLEDYGQDTCVLKKYYAVRQMMVDAGMIESSGGAESTE